MRTDDANHAVLTIAKRKHKTTSNMRKLLIITILALMPLTLIAQSEMIDLARKANKHLMSKWPDPTEVTFVKRKRTSNLWTRAVYYEG
ncbi:MAG: hypothetical protein II314_03300, partial [Prevotella sp.]|nr:hypothetical protein [Prevotella sp.]